MAYWGQVRGISDPKVIRRFDGVYKPDDEGFNQAEGLFTELVNFAPDEWPAITTRPGYTVPGTYGARVLGLGAWKDQELHAVFDDGTWRRLNGGGTWTTLASGLNTAAEWSFCNFKGNLTGINLIGSNGVDAIKRYDGSTVQNLANAPAGGNYIDTQGNRLYCAVDDILKYSALSKADDWTTANDAGEIQHNTGDGEIINGLNAGSGHVTVFKPSSTYELYGTGPASYRLDDVATDIGTTGDKAVTVHGDILPFLSRDGIYSYAGGLRPSKSFSDAVYQLMLGANHAQLAKCVAGSDGVRMYFGIPYGTATENSRILQYEPLRGAWYTWDDIAVTHMERVGESFYMGDASGRVLLVGGTTDDGGAITATAVTKPFTADSIARKQHWFKLWVVASITSGSTLSIYVSGKAAGDDSWTLARTLAAESEIQYQEIPIPTNSIAAANAVRIKLVAVGLVTIHEITRQLRELPMRR